MPDAQTSTPLDDPTRQYLRERGINMLNQGQGVPYAMRPPPQAAAQPPAPPQQQQPGQLSPLSTPNMGGPPPYPAPPKLQNMPEAPKVEFQDSLQALKSPMILLAALGSLFTRNPLTTAFNAAGEAVEGYNKGNLIVAEQKQKEFHDKLEAAINQNRVELEKYKDAWDRRSMSVKDKFAQMYGRAASTNDTIMQAAIASGNTDLVEKLIVGRETAQTKLDTAVQMLKMKQELTGGSPESNTQYAAAIAAGKEPPLTGYALRTPWGKNVMAEVHQINPDYDAAKDWYGKLAGARVEGAAIPRAEANALGKMVGQRSAVQAFAQTAVKNGRKLVELAEKVDETGIPVIEKWRRGGKQAMGDPDVAMFNTQMTLYRTEVAKILTNPNLTGVLSDSARHEAEGFLQGGGSAKQIKAVVELLEGDFKRRTDALDETINTLKEQFPGGGAPAAETGAGFKYLGSREAK